LGSCYDVVVVGAGPYGLSTAAHLRGRGLKLAVFGKTLGMWRDHMPKGMRLRSHGWATNLSDPRQEFTFERFLAGAGYPKNYPLPIDAFIEYGLWFQRHAVPEVDETYVTSIERDGRLYRFTLADGRSLQSRGVVMATGLQAYAHWPDQFLSLSKDRVSHSSDHSDFSRFKGQDVVVVGGGQSAIEFTALLVEAGANVQVVARRPIVWLQPDRAESRSRFERILAPNASIAPGWLNWVWDKLPYLFYRFPQNKKDAYTSGYQSGACDWLRSRVLGKATLHEGQILHDVRVNRGRLQGRLSGGGQVAADHIVLATGYRVDVNRLSMLHPALRAEIETDRGTPILNHWFEASVPGLFFVGATSLRAFGPLYRFVAGCPAAARRVSLAIARRCRAQQDAPAPAFRPEIAL
jgi:hypothetical protein